MTTYRFLWSPKWISGFLLTCLAATVCVGLGLWQWDRRQTRLAANALVTDNYDASPVALSQALTSADLLLNDALPRSATWRPVTLTGRYLPEHAVLVRNRPLDQKAGFYSAVPFLDVSGRVVVVDRGWLPTGSSGAEPDRVPQLPSGQLTVVARLKPAQPIDARSAPAGQVYSVAPAVMPGHSDTWVTSAFGVLASETPPAAENLVKVSRPPLDEGPHLSYSMQWFVYALGMFIGFGVVARRHAQPDPFTTGAAQQVVAKGRGPGRSRGERYRDTRRRGVDEEFEDALIDAQGQSSRG